MPGPLTELSEEELLFQASVRRFAKERLAPRVREMDEAGVFAPDLLRQLFDLGLMSIDMPEEYGGQGGTLFQSILAIEELARVDPSISVFVDVNNTLVLNAFTRWGTEEQKRNFMPRLAQDTVGAYALSEASSGSDAFALQTRATDQGDHYLLNGRKLWITNSLEAGIFLLFANVDPSKGYKGITAFIVEKDAPGFSVGHKEDKLGIRASSTCELILEDCRIPKENVLGEVGKGYKIAIETLNEGRIGIGAQMLGLAQGAYECALAYTKERKQFGQPIFDFQGIQFKLADMATQIDAARLLTLRAAWMKDNKRQTTRESAMAKLYASEIAVRVAEEAIQIHGGYGYTKDYPPEKYWRDSKLCTIGEGTSEVQRLVIARQLVAA